MMNKDIAGLATGSGEILACLEGTLKGWKWGFRFWGAVFYVGNSLAIGLPILVATGVFSGQQAEAGALGISQKVLLGITSIIVAIMSWLQPGAKASAHEHAFLALRTLVAEYKAQLLTAKEAMQALREYTRYIDYSYEDSNQPATANQETRSVDAKEPTQKS